MFTNPTNPLNLTQTGKYSSKEYIKYLKTSNNYVSDIPMISTQQKNIINIFLLILNYQIVNI